MTENSLPTSSGGSGGRSCLLSVVAIVVVMLVFSVGFGIGFGAGHFTATPASAAAASQSDDGGEELYPAFDTFWEAMDVLYPTSTVSARMPRRPPMAQSAAWSASSRTATPPL